MSTSARGALSDRLPDDPMTVVAGWLDEAVRRAGLPNPNAMTIATIDERGAPAARIVLCKGLVADPGYLVFFTNYRSRKGREIGANPRIAALFHWDEAGRQVRIEGPVVRSPATESDAYFATRPWQSRVGAWGSDQSEPIASRAALLEQVRARARELGAPDPTGADDAEPARAIPRPVHWGGYRLWAERVELWVSGAFRIHDRAEWRRELVADGDADFRPGPWRATRLQP